MPEFLICDGSQMPKYVRIDNKGKKAVWVDMGEATGFPTAETARGAFETACQAMIASATASGARALESGVVAKNEGHGRTGYLLKGKTSRHNKYATKPSDFFLPVWLSQKHGRLHDFPLGSRSTPDDLLGVFELFYARSDKGWLSRPQRKAAEGVLTWIDTFGLAVPFTSREAAEAALSTHHGHSGYVVKTSCAFTAVETIGRPSGDDTVGRIASACEARDIRAAMDESAIARLKALAEREAATAASSLPAPKKTSRL